MSSKPNSLRETVEAFIKSQHDVSQKTRDNYRYRLTAFVEFLESNEISTIDEIEGFHVEEYKNQQKEAEDWAPTTLRNHVISIRAFLQWAETIGLCEEGASDVVLVPDVSPDEEARDEFVEHERVTDIIEYLVDYEFASLQHIVFHTLYHTGVRRSSLVALDVEDWNSEERSLSLRHRPAEGTRLKGGESAERNIAITDDDLTDALNAWVLIHRPDSLDENGRCPLLTSGNGRLHGQTVTKICYRVTRPCWYGDPCPHDEDPRTCESTKAQQYSGCPSAVSAHPMRRSAITNHLRQDIPKDIVSERMSVSKDVLDQHYDERTHKEEKENRASRLADKDI